jgi:citrate synthase
VAIGSAVCAIGDGWIRYRDTDALALAVADVSYEDVAGLLWMYPGGGDWTLPAPVRRAVLHALGGCGPEASTVERMITALAVSAAQLSAPAPRTLIAVLLQAVPAVGLPPDPSLGVAERLWTSLTHQPPTPERIGLLNRALVLFADHELATSTLAVRVATSVRASLPAALIAGLATFGGPFHGGLATDVHRWLLGDLPGPVPAAFGAPVHAGGDPRAPLVLDGVRALATPGQRATLDAALTAGDAAPNFDFALGGLCYVAGMRPGAGEAIGAIARGAGWIAHAAEEAAERPLRFRARAVRRT